MTWYVVAAFVAGLWIGGFIGAVTVALFAINKKGDQS